MAQRFARTGCPGGTKVRWGQPLILLMVTKNGRSDPILALATRMAERRTRSIGTKVTASEYDLMTKLAAPKTVSEWARTILLDAAKPDSFQVMLLAEIISLRAIVLMINITIGQGKPVDEEFFSQLCR